MKAKEKEEVARGRRTPCLPLPSPFPLSSSTFGSTTTTLATRDFNYFLIRSFQSNLAGASRHNVPCSSLRMLNANLPPFATTPFACHTASFFCCLRCLHRGTRYILPPLLSPRKTVAPRGTAGQRLRGIFNADSWLVPRSIGVRLCRELRLA